MNGADLLHLSLGWMFSRCFFLNLCRNKYMWNVGGTSRGAPTQTKNINEYIHQENSDATESARTEG